MSPRSISDRSLTHPTPLHADDRIDTAVRQLLDSGVPALPVLGSDGRFSGIFGEREFMRALFPGYLDELRGAAFLRRSLDESLEKREACRTEHVARHMNTEHVDVGLDHSDAQLAEIFLHHRVLVVPVLDHGRVVGVITRAEFFRAIAERFLERQ